MNSKLYKSQETETIGDGHICIVPYSSIESLKCGLCKAEKHDIEIIKNLTECRFVPAMSYKEILSYAKILSTAKIIIDNNNNFLINNKDKMLYFSEIIKIQDGCFSPISTPYKNCANRIIIPSLKIQKDMIYNISMYYLKDYNIDYFFVVFIIRLNKSFNKIFNKNTDYYISINDIEKKYNNLPYIDKLIATEILYDNYNTVTTE